MNYQANIYEQKTSRKARIAWIMSLILHLAPLSYLLKPPNQLETSENIIDVALVKILFQEPSKELDDSQHSKSDELLAPQNEQPSLKKIAQPSKVNQELIVQNYEYLITKTIAQYLGKMTYDRAFTSAVIVRLLIDRAGNIISVSLDQSTNISSLNQRIINIVKSASPLPKVPVDYTSDHNLEFLLPIDLYSP